MLDDERLQDLRSDTAAFGNRLLKAMELARVTQVDVADGTGFTQSYVSRVARGQYERLPGETMRAFAAYFRCQIEDLFPSRARDASARPLPFRTPARVSGGGR